MRSRQRRRMTARFISSLRCSRRMYVKVMPINYARRIAGRRRSDKANRQLGFTLAFVAGATNAGGFLAVKQYTSHMTGIVSLMADHLALGEYGLALEGAGAVLSFLSGAISSAVMVNYARRRRMHSEYAIPLLFEAVLLLCFGILGARLSETRGLFVPVAVMLLCYIMGLQNAVITKLSRAEIRTTHITGIVTDIGIELGKLFYWNSIDPRKQPMVLANRGRLTVLGSMAMAFFLGALIGALGFKHIGYLSTVPLALALVTLASVPVIDDLVLAMRRWTK
ncbi:Uncharacterized membrane protein YoaK, UPF0700 family [Formivibrio citricus]|uniref:Uncharacterized membrane protein YoaK, UPF0700 family n=1 Tax=Formivibrio citricus TaxID=83765 RepID=A0A1I4XUZ5_9NEIS|nr:Uncharacterized membrane protein YoaK, UPF0700 family [Formivibrio citricus]